MRLLPALGVAIAACASSGRSAQSSSAAVTAGVSAVAESLDVLVPALLERQQVPGASVALVSNGAVVWSRGYGFADREAKTPMTGRTVMQVASISKSLAAWGVMKLVERGRLSLDAPAEQYLTRWHLPASDSGVYRSEVTIRRLLSHTAGLSLHGYPGFDPDSGPLPTLEANLSGATNGAGDVHIAQRPGTKWDYSGGGFTLLQLIVEERSGRAFAPFMKQEILEPLGMHESAYEWLPALRPKTAIGYAPDGRRLPNYLFTEEAAAGLYTTAEDLARFVAAEMRGPHGEPPGRGVLRPESIAALQTPVPTRADSIGSYGLGHMVNTVGGGMHLVMHTGGNRGWRTLYELIPERGVGLVLLTNSDRGGALLAPVSCVWARVAAQVTLPRC